MLKKSLPLVVVAVAAFWWLKSSPWWKRQFTPEVTSKSQVVFVAKRPTPQTPSAEEIAGPHLRRAEKRCEEAVEEQLKRLDTFFAQAKMNTPLFVDEVLSLSSTFRWIWDRIPFTSGDTHQQFVAKNFEKCFFGSEQLEKTIDLVVKSYLDNVRSIEGQMLVDLHKDLDDLPKAPGIIQLDRRHLQEVFNFAMDQATRGTQGHVVDQVKSIIVGEMMSRIALRLAIRAIPRGPRY